MVAHDQHSGRSAAAGSPADVSLPMLECERHRRRWKRPTTSRHQFQRSRSHQVFGRLKEVSYCSIYGCQSQGCVALRASVQHAPLPRSAEMRGGRDRHLEPIREGRPGERNNKTRIPRRQGQPRAARRLPAGHRPDHHRADCMQGRRRPCDHRYASQDARMIAMDFPASGSLLGGEFLGPANVYVLPAARPPDGKFGSDVLNVITRLGTQAALLPITTVMLM